MVRPTGVRFPVEREVMVLSHDVAVRDEVHAVVHARPWARATFADAGVPPGRALGAARIVVIDDEACADSVALVQRLRGEGESAVVYLTAAHTPALEQAVRRAGASFYAVKPARNGDLGRVLAALLGRSEVPGS